MYYLVNKFCKVQAIALWAKNLLLSVGFWLHVKLLCRSKFNLTAEVKIANL